MTGLRNKSILVIDDDASLLRALKKVLCGEGAVVTTADRGGDGLELLSKRDKRFDLVITDLQMPFVSGFTVARVLRETFPTLPVVVLTAFANPEVRAACLEQGAVALLEKPVGSQELIAALEAVVRAGAPKRRPNPSFPKYSHTASRPIKPASGDHRRIKIDSKKAETNEDE
jgi:DNA-binding response OmpR family regulator